MCDNIFRYFLFLSFNFLVKAMHVISLYRKGYLQKGILYNVYSKTKINSYHKSSFLCDCKCSIQYRINITYYILFTQHLFFSYCVIFICKILFHNLLLIRLYSYVGLGAVSFYNSRYMIALESYLKTRSSYKVLYIYAYIIALHGRYLIAKGSCKQVEKQHHK